MNPSIKQLLDFQRQSYYLGSAEMVLNWDMRTQMPPLGNRERGKTLKILAQLQHERSTSPGLGGMLQELSSGAVMQSLSEIDKAQVIESERLYKLATRLPMDFVEELAEKRVLSQAVWLEAKAKADFSIFEPILTEIVALKRREAEFGFKEKGSKGHPYDSLVEFFEPEMTVAQLDPLFGETGVFLSSVLQSIGQSSKVIAPKTTALIEAASGKSYFPKATQEYFGDQVVRQLGFDMQRGRIDSTVHPFCSGTHTDTRLTTRYDEDDPFGSFFGLVHETGHGLYTQGLPADIADTPAGNMRSLGVHESQSLLYEDLIGRSTYFWDYFYEKWQAAYKPHFETINRQDFVAYVNKVTPSLVRVDADEVTYILHIIIRYELEKRLIEGSLEVKDLPAEWSLAYKKYLGITPPNDALGVLQDVHWSQGYIGYFPVYALGKLMGAQLFEQMNQDVSSIEADACKGDFSKVLQWLRQKVHSQGCLYTTDQLLRRATGTGLCNKAFKRHVATKVLTYYGVKIDV